MANSNTGAKFLPANLNKSYGPSGPANTSTNVSGSYGPGRGRVGGYGGKPGGGGGGGDMVLLSRPRSAHKAQPKLSVPPPLNLPSLRKEQRFDILGSGAGSVAGGAPGVGTRPATSGAGWSKPSSSAFGSGDIDGAIQAQPPCSESSEHDQLNLDGSNKLGTINPYTCPSFVPGSAGRATSVPILPDKTLNLRGDDFPSLKATLVPTNGSVQKQKDGLHQNQPVQGLGEELSTMQKDGSHPNAQIDVHPSFPPLLSLNRCSPEHGSSENRSKSSQLPESVRRQNDYFPEPLPLVSLSLRSDWADDERDVSHGFTDRARADHTYSKTDSYLKKDFDFPRGSILPDKLSQNHFSRWGHRDDGTSIKILPSEVPKVNSYGEAVRIPIRDVKDGLKTQDFAERADTSVREKNYVGPQGGGSVNDEFDARNRDSAYGRKDAGYVLGAWQNPNNLIETSNKIVERNLNYKYERRIESNKYKVNSAHSSSVSRSSFSLNNRGQPRGDPVLSFGRDKHSSSRGETLYMGGWGGSDFDSFDSFSCDPFGVVKRKKDVGKQEDFHDPIRESFEAELERVQKVQEQERQRIFEEQERAMEMALREKKEKQRVAREQEEHRIRLEEEAREAASREEQEKLQSIRRAEEQKVAREEEKRRILMEEERRKQAARQKLQELEEKIARRQAEAAKADGPAVVDERISAISKDKTDDVGSWEDSERMTDRISNSTASDSSTQNRPSYEDFWGLHPLRDGNSIALDRGQPSSVRRNVFDNGKTLSYLPHELENGDGSSQNNAFTDGSIFPGKKFYNVNEYTSSSVNYRDNFPEPQVDDFSHSRASRLNFSGDICPFGSNKDLNSEFHQGHSGGNFHTPYPDHGYQNTELDELYEYGKPRLSTRQPRVIPPPSLASYARAPDRDGGQNAGSSTYDDDRVQNNHKFRTELPNPTYADGKQDMKELPDILDAREEIAKIECQDLKGNSACRCDSQSSISVTSPPHSPAHISHADLDESGDYLAATASPESNEIYPPVNVSVVMSAKSSKEILVTDSSSMPMDDDDDDWPIIRNEELQQQEEYDEDNDGYHEDEEVLVRDDENADLAQELDGLCLDGKGPPAMTDNLVLGFDQGVEVGIISDQYESKLLKEENLYAAAPASAGVARQAVSFDGRQNDGPTLCFGDNSHTIPSGSPGVIQELQNIAQDSVTHPNPHASSSSEPLTSANATSGCVLPAVQPVTSMDNALYSSWPTVGSSTASEQIPAETPVKLQFGLFSGPSLISSPIPSIQIGSIQMPFQLHPHVGTSLSHMHSPQPPLFQFGQLRYPSPICHGPMPLPSQSMSFGPPNAQTTYTLNQNPCPPIHLFQGGSTSGFGKNNFSVASTEEQISESHSSSQVIVLKEANSDAGENKTENNNLAVPWTNIETPNSLEKVARVEYSKTTEIQRSQCNNTRSNSSVAGASEGLIRPQFQGKGINDPPLAGQMSGNKGRRYSFIGKNSGQKLSPASGEASGFEANGFQRKPRRGVRRMEFRVRRSADKRQPSTSLSSNRPTIDLNADNQRVAESFSRGSFNHGVLLDRSKQTIDSGNYSSKQLNFHGTSTSTNTFMGNEKDASAKDSSRCGESSLKRNMSSEYDVDAPLQSGIVRIFNQPGIEVPSDENDFIEVRSKRQMLNNRREQREKEIKANLNKNKKVVRKHSSVPHSTPAPATFNKVPMSLNKEVPNTIYAHSNQKQGLVHGDASTGFSKMFLPLAPIGTPCINTESPANGRSDDAKSTAELSCIYDSKKVSLDGAPISLASWCSQHNHEVMPLTQSQFDEAMKPAQFNVTPISEHLTRPVSNPCGSASSMLLKDKSFQAAPSPINSLLAGEKIQFGAVTSPTVFPPSSDQPVSHNIRSTGSSSRPDLQNSPRAESDISRFKKEKQAEDSSSALLQDCEAEARAVAAISNNEAVENANSMSMIDAKKYGGTVVDGISFGGVAHGHQPTSESKVSEPLSVSLPADLSVETPISIWPPLPSPQSSSSSQMLCPFPGVTPSRLPIYEMNPVMGSPVFTFGPPDEAVSSQSQPQNSSSSGPVSLGSWQQCHSGMDSFYGTPAGYPGGIPSAQGPTPMVIYNHFAPVGQVGSSYYGTYVPSGKPNWNHVPATAGGGSEGEMKSLNILPPQHHPLPPSMPPPSAQHLGPRSHLLSTPSPMAMFDVFPFQSSSNMAVPAHWSHGSHPPLHAILSHSMPLAQQQAGGGALVPLRNHGPTTDDDSCAPPNRCSSKPQTPSPDEKNVDAELAAPSAHIWNEPRHFVDQHNSSVGPKSSHIMQEHAASLGKSNVQPNRPTGHQYNQQRGLGSSSQKTRGAGAEWSNNRKMGFHGRSHSSGGERGGFVPGKMKQIYVAKRAPGEGASTTTA